MSKLKSKVIDLEISSDGLYEPKRIKERGGVHYHRKGNISYKEKSKHMIPSGADEFLMGIDTGLELLDNIVPRVERFLKLRG